MLTHQPTLLFAFALMLSACSGTPPNWLRGDPNYTVPPITNNG